MPLPRSTSSSVAPSTTTTLATTTTAVLSKFPSIINAAMATVQPRPPGLEAPDVLPATPGAVSAEVVPLAGTYSITLIATPTEEPVNSPQLAAAAADPSSDLGTFSVTASASAADAQADLHRNQQEDLEPCSGPSTPLALHAQAATTCTTAQGPVVNWALGTWAVQVADLGGTSVPTSTATDVANWLASHVFPQAASGVVSVSVPGPDQAGNAATTTVVWDLGTDVYQVDARRQPSAALELASSMRPWPSG